MEQVDVESGGCAYVWEQPNNNEEVTATGDLECMEGGRNKFRLVAEHVAATARRLGCIGWGRAFRPAT